MTPSWADIATFSVLAAAAAVGLWQVWETRSLRRAQIRPFVILDVECEYATEVFFLVLRNYGSTLARDIEIDIDPPLESGLHEEVRQLDRLQAWAKSVDTLAPGVERRAIFDVGTLRSKHNPPETFAVRIRYRDHDRKRPFDEMLTLDVATAWGLGRVDSGAKTVDHIHEELERIANALERREG